MAAPSQASYLDLPFDPAYPIAVVGNINLDIKTSPIPASSAILADGESSVREIYETIGGGAANVAAAACGLGGKVHLCGCIGDDACGNRLAHFVEDLGIKSHLTRKPAPTGQSINLTWDNHCRHFVSSLPSAALLEREDVDLKSLAAAGCRHLYRGDLWFAEKMWPSGNLDLLREARALGMETSLDLNWDPAWNARDPSSRNPVRIAQTMALMPHLSFIQCNERELCFFTDDKDPREAAMRLIENGAGAVILHCGAAGSAALSSDETWHEAAASPIPRIVTETGSGDVFSAAFMLLHRLLLPERLTRSNQVAARHLEGRLNLIPRLEQ